MIIFKKDIINARKCHCIYVNEDMTLPVVVYIPVVITHHPSQEQTFKKNSKIFLSFLMIKYDFKMWPSIHQDALRGSVHQDALRGSVHQDALRDSIHQNWAGTCQHFHVDQMRRETGLSWEASCVE